MRNNYQVLSLTCYNKSYCLKVTFNGIQNILKGENLMHLSIVSGTGGGRATSRKIDRAKSSLRQRFDRQLDPASGGIDNPRKN